VRFLQSRLLWGRPVAQARIIKYSGNAFGADMLLGPGLKDYAPIYGDKSFQNQNYSLPDVYSEGATYAIPRWVSRTSWRLPRWAAPGWTPLRSRTRRRKNSP